MAAACRGLRVLCLGYWPEHKSRLDRNLKGNKGTKLYAKEELVAEMTTAFICAALGIVPTIRHADYIGSWLTVLKDDKRFVFKAASLASKAADGCSLNSLNGSTAIL